MNLIGWHWQVPETGHKKQDQATQPIGIVQRRMMNNERGLEKSKSCEGLHLSIADCPSRLIWPSMGQSSKQRHVEISRPKPLGPCGPPETPPDTMNAMTSELSASRGTNLFFGKD